MNTVVKASVGLVVAVAAVQLVLVLADFHKNPVVPDIVAPIVFVVLNVVAVIWALKTTAEGSSYGKQLMNGTLIGLLAGVTILVFSFVMLSYIFPNYVQEWRDASIASMQGTEMAKDARVSELNQITPLMMAVPGFVGTFFTSVVVAAIAAIFLRKK